MTEVFLVERQTVSRKGQCDKEDERKSPADGVEQTVARLLESTEASSPTKLIEDLSSLVRDDAAGLTSCYAKDYFVLRLMQSLGRNDWARESIEQLTVVLATECGVWALYYGIFGTLKDPSTSRDRFMTLNICLAGLELLLLEKASNSKVTSLWSKATNVDDPSTFVTQVLVALPNLIAKVYDSSRQGIPPMFVVGNFHARLVETAAAWNTSPQSNELVRHLLRRNGGEAVVLGLFRHWCSCDDAATGNNQEWSQQHVRSFVASLDLSEREAAVWVRAVLRHHVSYSNASLAWMRLVCHGWMSQCWETICEWIVLSTSSVMTSNTALNNRPVVDPRLCHTWAELLQGCIAAEMEDEDDDSVYHADGLCDSVAVADQLLWRCIHLVAQQWSTTQFVRDTDELLQQHVSHFLRHGLELLGDVPIEHLCALDIVTGISERLKSSVQSVRLDGMRIGVVLAKLQGQELIFTELEEAESLPQRVEDDHPPKPDVVEVTRLDSVREVEEAEPERFSLEDDQEDLLIVPKPLYLSECLDLLRTADNDEHAGLKQETAMRHVSDLVRSRPADLCDHAPEIARTILRTRNRCHLENYSALERSALCSLVTQEPRAVGLELIEEMFEDSAQNDRFVVLCALLDGAMELSGATALLDHIPPIKDMVKTSGKGSFLLQRGDPKDALNQHEVKSTRWGRGKRRNQKTVCLQNRFKDVGPIWFYALTKRFMETKEKSNLWGFESGSFLLARLLDTLNGVLYCVGPFAPGIDIMIKDLWELSWVFREAEVSEVRLSVLRSLTTVLEFQEQDASLAIDAPRDLPQYLQNVAMNDPEETCRSLASSLIDGMSAKTIEQPLLAAASTMLKKQVV